MPKQNPDLVALMEERGLSVHAGMTDRDMHIALEHSVPSEAQLSYIKLLTGRDDVPVKSYGHARKVIAALQDIKNTAALDAHGWEEGSVILWKGAYYKVLLVYGSSAWHRFRLTMVRLEFPAPGQPATVVVLSKQAESHNPHTVSDQGGLRVDLATGQPIEPQDTNPPAD